MIRRLRIFLAGFLIAIAISGAAWGVPPEIKFSMVLPTSSVTVATGVTASNTRMPSATSFLYEAGFQSLHWSGSLKKLALVVADDGSARPGPAPIWDAALILSGRAGVDAIPPAKDRRIFTSILDDGRTVATVEFDWAELADPQRALLDRSPWSGRRDGLGKKRLDYLRGERALEIGKSDGIFRKRDGILGDIVHCAPVYVGPPAPTIQGMGYERFAERYKGRSLVVYVGANDGMLHAFDADSGRELFAYVPNALLASLNWLTHPAYAHRSYVDGGIAVAEASWGGRWGTALVAGMGRGAQGVFALDVTNPADFGAGRGLLWEFTDHDDADLGNVLGAPTIAKFITNVIDGKPMYRYFAVVSSGVNNYTDDGAGKFNRDGDAALFLLALDKAPGDKWQINRNYFKFSVPASESTHANGLSAPATVLGSDGAVRYVYAGDLQGNLWRFDFTGKSPWKRARAGDGPLFTARDEFRVRQPITTQPAVVFAPGDGYLVLFGTGKLMEEGDLAPPRFAAQSYYAIFDNTDDAYHVAGRRELEPRFAERDSEGRLVVSGRAFSIGTGVHDKNGWYFDFPASQKTGERSIKDADVAQGKVVFNSYLPCRGPCTGPSGYQYMLSALTGLSDTSAAVLFAESGISFKPLLLELAVRVATRTSGAEPGRLATAERPKATSDKLVGPASLSIEPGTGAVASVKAEPSEIASKRGHAFSRLGWRELLNLQELRHALASK